MKYKICFLLSVILIYTLQSQPDFDLNYINDYRKTFSIQPIYYPNENGDSLEVFVPFRFSLNYLTFEKTGNLDRFYSNFFLEFIFRDGKQIIRKSLVFRDTLFFTLLQKDLINIRSYLNFVHTRLPLQDFELEVSLYDKEKVKTKTTKADIKINKFGNFSFFSPIYASRQSNGKEGYVLSLLTNSLDFTTKDKVIIFPVSPSTNIEYLRFRIKSYYIKMNQMNWQKDVDFEIKPLLLSNTPFVLSVDTNYNAIINFYQKATTGSGEQISFLLLEFPEKYAYLQNYYLFISQKNSKDSLKLGFKIHWENPPLSLKSLQYALELMYYILTDSQYNYLLSLKREQQWNEFFDMWRQFDIDTSTLFNEAMNEYYKRADFAVLNFQTIEENDGAKSERGKIFILFGKPSEIQRNIDKNGTIVENWIYYRLRKQFTFVSVRKKFELLKITDL